MSTQEVDYTILKNKGVWMTPADVEGFPYSRRTRFVKLLHRRRYPEGREPVGLAYIRNFSNKTLHLYIDETFVDRDGIQFQLLEPINLAGGESKISTIIARTYQYFHGKREYLWSTETTESPTYSLWQDQDDWQLETPSLTPDDLDWADPVWTWEEQDQAGIWLFEIYVECTGGSERGYDDYVSENSEDIFFPMESNETLRKLYLTSEDRSGYLLQEVTLKPGLRFTQESTFHLPPRYIRIRWSGVHPELIRRYKIEVWQ